MPIFEYRCGGCRKKFERIVLGVRGGEAPACPHCGAGKAERLVSRFATASKGGGDDFGSDIGDGFGGDEGLGDDETDMGYGGSRDEEPWGGPPLDDDNDHDEGLADEAGEDDD